jgi:ABC-type Fe3+-siderophore transport system permease subunit
MADERTSTAARGAFLLVMLAGAMWLRMAVGRDPVTGTLEWTWPEPSIASLRAGALWSAVVAGASLGLSGLLLQVLLRNPLASPFVLGLSSGAGLGATLAAWAAGAAGAAGAGGWIAALAATGAVQVLPATVGALLTLGIVLVLGMRRGVIEPVSMVLAGTVVAAPGPEGGPSPLARLLAWPLYAAIPNLQFFWSADALTQGNPMTLGYFGAVSLYAAFVVGAVISLAVLLFQHRDVG